MSKKRINKNYNNLDIRHNATTEYHHKSVMIERALGGTCGLMKCFQIELYSIFFVKHSICDTISLQI